MEKLFRGLTECQNKFSRTLRTLQLIYPNMEHQSFREENNSLLLDKYKFSRTFLGIFYLFNLRPYILPVCSKLIGWLNGTHEERITAPLSSVWESTGVAQCFRRWVLRENHKYRRHSHPLQYELCHTFTSINKLFTSNSTNGLLKSSTNVQMCRIYLLHIPPPYNGIPLYKSWNFPWK